MVMCQCTDLTCFCVISVEIDTYRLLTLVACCYVLWSFYVLRSSKSSVSELLEEEKRTKQAWKRETPHKNRSWGVKTSENTSKLAPPLDSTKQHFVNMITVYSTHAVYTYSVRQDNFTKNCNFVTFNVTFPLHFPIENDFTINNRFYRKFTAVW